MTLPAHLHRDENGQVLYMTVVLMMLLAAFALVLANVIYLACMKIKVQNAADNLALSVAARQAQVLNRLAEYNRQAASRGTDLTREADALIRGYNRQVDENPNFIDRINRANGLRPEASMIGLWPRPFINRENCNQVACQIRTVYSEDHPDQAATHASYGPQAPWSIQSRVELRVKQALIGGARLGIRLPDLAARARAEIYDRRSGETPQEGKHAWDVRLVRPSFEDDEINRLSMRQYGEDL